MVNYCALMLGTSELIILDYCNSMFAEHTSQIYHSFRHILSVELCKIDSSILERKYTWILKNASKDIACSRPHRNSLTSSHKTVIRNLSSGSVALGLNIHDFCETVTKL